MKKNKELEKDVMNKVEIQNKDKDLLLVIMKNIETNVNKALDCFKKDQNEKDLNLSKEIKELYEIVLKSNAERKEIDSELFYKTEIIKKQNEKINILIEEQAKFLQKLNDIVIKDRESLAETVRDQGKMERKFLDMSKEIKRLWVAIFGSSGIVTIGLCAFFFLLKFFKMIP